MFAPNSNPAYEFCKPPRAKMPFAPFKTVVQPGPLLKKYKKATKHEVFVIANTEQDLTSRVRVAFKISPGVDLQYFLVFKDSQEPQSVEAKRVLEAAQACLHNITSPEALDWKALLEQPEAQGFTFLVDVADRAALGKYNTPSDTVDRM